MGNAVEHSQTLTSKNLKSVAMATDVARYPLKHDQLEIFLALTYPETLVKIHGLGCRTPQNFKAKKSCLVRVKSF